MPSRLNLVATSRSQSGSALSRKAIERSTPDVGFREPDAIVGGTPVWLWSTIQRWSQRTGYP